MNDQEQHEQLDAQKGDKGKKKVSIFKRGFVWRPVPTIVSTTLCFSISGVICLIIGIIIVVLSKDIQEIVIRYDNISECHDALEKKEDPSNPDQPVDKTCIIEISVTKKMKDPVMVYYQLENFYQNHRRYMKSRSLSQLKGKLLTTKQIKDDCDPIVTIADLGINKSKDGTILPPDAPANPCGLIARSLFNDTYKLYLNKDSSNEVLITSQGIAWESDLKGRYERPENWEKVQWTDVKDERFMVWMRPAGLPDFRKLWGKTKNALEPSTYYLKIENNYPVDSFNGRKSFVLSTVNGLGGKNRFLGISYLVVGVICLVLAVLFWVGYSKLNGNRKEKKN